MRAPISIHVDIFARPSKPQRHGAFSRQALKPQQPGPCDWRWLAGFRSTHFGRENGINNGQLHRSIANRWIYVYITHDIWSIMLYMMCSILHITYIVYISEYIDTTFYKRMWQLASWVFPTQIEISLCRTWFHVALGLANLSMSMAHLQTWMLPSGKLT